MDKIEVVPHPKIEELLKQQRLLLEMQVELIKLVSHPMLVCKQEKE